MLTLDPSVCRFDDGRVLLGGSPLRILRLKEAGAAVVGRWVAGEPIGGSRGRAQLARRLLDAGFVHPVPSPVALDPATITVVVPVCDDLEALAATMASLRVDDGHCAPAVVVVDDGSAIPIGPGDLEVGPDRSGRPLRVELCRRPAPGGPGIARQHGLARVRTPLVAFVDAGVVLPCGWWERLGAHFADPAVAAVAPRIASRPGPSPRDRYEQAQSPLDLGAVPARVAPRSRVAYVPTAVLLARREALDAVGGFDPGLRYGEDVDLVWRLVGRGATVRYAPEVVAEHAPRRSWAAWWRQRVGYGSAAAPLAQRHPGLVPPVQVSAWSAAAWLAVAAGHPLLGAALAGGSTALLPRKLAGLPAPNRRALELAGAGHLLAGRWLGRAVLRPYWPVALVAALCSRRARRVVLAAAVLPALLDWWEQRPALDVARFVGLRVADDIAYGAGVWLGCVRSRSWAALRPDLSNWPGRANPVEESGAQAPSSQLGARSSR
ncbi:MAG: mycofactocin biosynthesis glycosyltransferase MftF [Acidimicrobiales bacterium]|nr:mycofactocin biosynthesis glycosyltransferase MftF [Acidimicrobiales bacterium]